MEVYVHINTKQLYNEEIWMTYSFIDGWKRWGYTCYQQFSHHKSNFIKETEIRPTTGRVNLTWAISNLSKGIRNIIRNVNNVKFLYYSRIINT